MCQLHENERAEMVAKIKYLHNAMCDLTIKFGRVSQRAYDMVVSKVEFFNDTELESCYAFLKEVHDKFYLRVVQVYKMPPNPEVTWDSYRLLKIEGLQEQKLMVSAGRALHEAWRRPYKPTRRIHGPKKQDSESQGVEGDSNGVSV